MKQFILLLILTLAVGVIIGMAIGAHVACEYIMI